MSSRSRDAQHLARLLTEYAEVEVRVDYHGHARDHHGGWHVGWTDGPTVSAMRRLVVPMLPIRAWDRSATDLAKACALLTWLTKQDEPAARVGEFINLAAQDAYDATEFPERSDEATRRRARRLLDPRGYLLSLGQLREHLATGGVPRVLEWLDGISTGTEHPGVPDLAEYRRRRDQAR